MTLCRRWESNPHSEEHGPKPCAYANSATPAYYELRIMNKLDADNS